MGPPVSVLDPSPEVPDLILPLLVPPPGFGVDYSAGGLPVVSPLEVPPLITPVEVPSSLPSSSPSLGGLPPGMTLTPMTRNLGFMLNIQVQPPPPSHALVIHASAAFLFEEESLLVGDEPLARFLLLLRSRDRHGDVKWFVPAGKVDPGDYDAERFRCTFPDRDLHFSAYLACIDREVFEETGIPQGSLRFHVLPEVHRGIAERRDGSFTHWITVQFVAQVPRSDLSHLLLNEERLSHDLLLFSL